ncbi:MAG: hypothetical protein KAG14_00375 [Mycoplasmataceae bacterium]|nr:hypothetical protein [Mycoplasmataceae bacterium]
MIKNNKKIFLSLGTITSIITPIAAVISCGTIPPTSADADLKIKLKNDESLKTAKDTWQKMIIQAQIDNVFNDSNGFDYTTKDGTTNFKNFSFNEIRNAAQNYVINKLMKDNGWLRKEGAKIITTKVFRELSRREKKEVNELATSWHLNSYRENGVIKFTNGDAKEELSEHALAFMFDNDDNFKQGVIHSLISYKYLSNTKITGNVFEKIFYDKDKNQHLSEIQKNISDDHFLVIDQMIKQKLAFSWSASQSDRIKLAALSTIYNNQDSTRLTGLIIDKNNKLHSYINTLHNADNQMEDDSKEIYKSLNYSSKNKKILQNSQYSILLNKKTALDRIQFDGITSVPSGKGVLKLNFKSLKEAIGYSKWDGFLQESRLVRKKINFFPEGSIFGPLSMKRYQGIMPIFTKGKFEIPDFCQALTKLEDVLADNVLADDIKTYKSQLESLTWLLSNNSSVYFDAKKYYLNRKDNPIKLKIKSKYLKELLIDHGFDFIKED